MKKILDISLKGKTIGLLVFSMVFMAIATTIIVSTQSKSILLKKSEDALISAREVKANQIEDFFKKQIAVKATDPYPVDEMDVDDIIDKYDEFFQFYAKEYGYYDIYVICPKHGHVMYSQSQKSDFGANLSSGELKNSALAKVWKKVHDTKKISFVDMQPYEPSKGEPAMFIGAPVMINGFLKGVVVFQISDEEINKIMQFREGYGASQEDYLVGQDKLMRSNSYLDPKGHSLKASFANPTTGKVDTVASVAALSGKTGLEIVIDYNNNPVLSAYKPIKIGNDITWALMSEIDEAEIMIAPNSFRDSIIISSVVIFIIAILISYFLLNIALVVPLKDMENRAEDLAHGDGDLTQRLNLKGNNEIAHVGNYINDFIKKVQDTIVQAKVTSNENAQVANKLASASVEIGKKAEEESKIVNDVSTQGKNIQTVLEAAIVRHYLVLTILLLVYLMK